MDDLSRIPEVADLLRLGDAQGYVSLDTVEQRLPTELRTPGQIDEVCLLLRSRGISVLPLAGEATAPDQSTTGEVQSGECVPFQEQSHLASFINSDGEESIWAHFRHIGQASLIPTREETRLVDVIRQGQDAIRRVVLQSSILLPEVRARVNAILERRAAHTDLLASREDGVEPDYSRRFEELTALVIDTEQRLAAVGKKNDAPHPQEQASLPELERDNILDYFRKRLTQIGLCCFFIDELASRIKTARERLDEFDKYRAQFERTHPVDLRGLLGLRVYFKPQARAMPEDFETRFGMTAAEAQERIREVQRHERQIEEIKNDFNVSVETIRQWATCIVEWEVRIENARESLIQVCLPLVVHIARSVDTRGQSFFDLVQRGNIGLMKAVDRFDYHGKTRFSEYAAHWVRQSLGALTGKAPAVQASTPPQETAAVVMREAQHLLDTLGREPTVTEIADSLGWSLEQVQGSADAAAEAQVAPPAVQGREEALGLLRKELAGLLQELEEGERSLMEQRFGLADGTIHSLEDLEKKFGISASRIRELEASVLRRLRHVAGGTLRGKTQ